MFRAALTRWLQAPPVTGWLAFVFALVALWVPTIIRLSVSGVVTGCEFTPYLPFVLLCAILLRWWQASAVAVAAVAILGGLFAGAPQHNPACFMPAAAIFLASSAVMIGVAILVRSVIVALQKSGADESSGGVVFSLEKGQVWASWYGQGSPVLLGSQRKVSAMMEDFLAQEELGRRLNGR
jgi:hypothetical protein